MVCIILLTIVVGIIAFLSVNGYILKLDKPQNGELPSGVLLKGGGLKVESDPRGATISLNGVIKGKTTKEFPNQEPGSIDVEINDPGYYPWINSVNVEEGYVTNISATLFTQNPRKESTSESIEILGKFYPFSDREIAVFQKKVNGPLWLGDFGRSIIKNNDSFKQLTTWDINLDGFKVLPSNDGQKILLMNVEKKEFYIIETTNVNNNTKANSKNEFKVDVTNLDWGKNGDTLFVFSKDQVFSYNLSTEKYILLHTNKNNIPFNYFNSGYLTIETNENEKSYIKIYSDEAALVTSLGLSDYSNTKMTFNAIFADDNGKNILLADSKNLYYVNIDKKVLEKVSSNFTKLLSYTIDGKKALFEEDNAVYSFILDNKNVYGVPRKNLISAVNHSIQPQWTLDTKHIVGVSGTDSSSVLRLLDWDGTNVIPIFAASEFKQNFLVTQDFRFIILVNQDTLNKALGTETEITNPNAKKVLAIDMRKTEK